MTKIAPRKAALAMLAPITIAAVFTAGITHGADGSGTNCPALPGSATEAKVLMAMNMAMAKSPPRETVNNPAEEARRVRRQRAFDEFWAQFTRESGN